MAIQVSGTSVINDSRQLQNIASVDSTTAASMTAAGVGGGAPTAPAWASPTENITSNATWTKSGKGIADDDWVWFYLIGGGGSSTSAGGGAGGSGGGATIVSVKGVNVPASLTLVIGAGGVNTDSNGYTSNDGEDTTIEFATGRFITAKGGRKGINGNASRGDETRGSSHTSTDAFTNAIDGTHGAGGSGTGSQGEAASNTVFGGGAGGGRSNTSTTISTSTYGGAGSQQSQAANAPGGGGSGWSGSTPSGAAGSIRIYY